MLIPKPPEKLDSPCLIYVMDPMCSWCWAFAKTLKEIREQLPTSLPFYTVLGGLAPDSDEPMPMAMREQIQQIWKQIESRTGTPFNHDFWTNNTPRRSTYPACRAVIAAASGDQDLSNEMIDAIQQGYYLNAQNPSDIDILATFSEQLGVNPEAFSNQLVSPEIDQQLSQHLAFSANLGVQGFPTLTYIEQQQATMVSHGYTQLENVLERLESLGLALTKS